MSTQWIVAHTVGGESAAAGREIVRQISTEFTDKPADALILFVSPSYDFPLLLETIREQAHPHVLVGCSSAGEFAGPEQREGSIVALALRSDEMQFTGGMVQHVAGRPEVAAADLAAQFSNQGPYPYRYALILADALAGYTDEFLTALTRQTAGTYEFFGGGAGDNDRFGQTYVFRGMEIASNAVAALEILSNKPLGIGVSHGWRPASPPLRVTEAEGMRLVSLNAAPAAEVMAEHAEQTGQIFDRSQPVPFFLHNALGIDTGAGYKLRVPLTVHEDASLGCASDVPSGVTACIMSTDASSAEAAAVEAAAQARRGLQGNAPGVALFFDCVATRLRLGQGFDRELDAVHQELDGIPLAGCNTYGQVVRARGQFNGFHNCTAVVCVIPA